MISVSSSDARNEIGLGFGGGIEEEEDMEMDEDEEEESTHSYVSCVDPDVALSYIDEKLENVLGHFQKDFEGGVSAENLGAKYGGYGSFLSMYQRSPACKSPPQVVGQPKCSPSPSKAGSTSKAPPPASSDVLAKMKNLVKSSNDIKQKPLTKTSPSPSSSSAPSNHKTLKLRIKVGSKSDLSLKNVSTYDGKQGLNMMPPSEVEEGLLNGTHDSPTKILMAMVSFPFHKDRLLSPLSDDLIQLGKKGNIMKDALRCVKKEKLKYMPPPSNRLDGSHIVSDTDREVDKESSCEELVSKTMKLPLLSCLSPSSIHRAKEIDKVSDSYVEGALRRMSNTDLDAALMGGSKPELEDDVVAFPDQSVEGTESVNTRKDMEEGEHVDPVVKVSKSEEQSLKSKLPKAQKSRKSSSRNGLRGKDAAVNVINTSLPDKLQEDIGDSGEAKEQEQSSLVPKSKKENLSEESAVKEEENEESSDPTMAISTLTLTSSHYTRSFRPTISSSSSSSSSFSCLCSSSSSSTDCQQKQRSFTAAKTNVFGVGLGLLAATILSITPLDADATRIEYYATVGDPLCEYSYAKSGLGFCDIAVGFGDKAPRGVLVNVHYTARFADGTLFDSTYKRARPLTMRIGVGKVIRGLDQGILGGEGVPPMRVGGKRKLQIPPKLAYGPEPAGCFSGDCNIPGNATLLYDINFVEIYPGSNTR